MTDDPQFEMVREDPPRALPESYREIKNNIERVRMGASGEWFRIAVFTTLGQAGTRRGTLKKRPEYQLFEFYAGKLDPPIGEFTHGLWCKWVGVKKRPKKDVKPEAEPERALRAVRNR